MPPDTLMLFAAGFGTRMGALTADRPKPLIDVAGKPLIDHALTLAEEANLGRIVVNTHYRAAQLEAHLAGRAAVRISRETPEILDTGGGLRHALPLLGAETVFTLNSDAVWAGPNPLRHLAGAWDPSRMDALLLLIEPGRARGRSGDGDFTRAADGALRRGGPMVYTGAQILHTGGLGRIDQPVFSLNRVWDRLIADGRLFGVRYPGLWCDVGHPEGIAAAERMLAETRDV
ncbi:MurNAc alpha-1-phosphate uridylyltransferase [Rhodovulum sp. ES.010]|uniref:nucleotidyltransferase family protein n=1 Tax=Rhodovulum sp. ES.010 TaxID=1882821 RepID=UPI00092C8574|nr:nucleotidyltransferase family protein [Rhodovulum sp. ES.010]SIO49566.1 MurNAc alpha-1-phosphate uridylyltransferase [Rhodovulum sp. ES.010]